MYYTGKGDTGASSLFSSQARTPKDAPIFEALGTLDELTSYIGYVRAHSTHAVSDTSTLANTLLSLQNHIATLQAELAGAGKRIMRKDVLTLEHAIAHITTTLTPLRSFIIPGATETSALLDYARTLARKAERRVVALSHTHPISPPTLAYLNRLSSLLYVLARSTAQSHTAHEDTPLY